MKAFLVLLTFLISIQSFGAYKLKNTYYYFIDENDYQNQDQTQPVLSLSGHVLAMVSPLFYRDLKMEGSGKTTEGKMLNYAGTKDGQVRFRYTNHDYGTGVGNCPLIPYKTIAVDPDVVPFGSKVFIKETLGMKLPDGSIHDGNWMAEDTGSAIVGNRVDIFVGSDRKGKYLNLAKIKHLQALTTEIVDLPSHDSCVYQTPSHF